MNFPKYLKLIVLKWSKKIAVNSMTTIERSYFHPVHLQLLSLFAEVFKLSYELVSPSDTGYGRRLPNGNWTGMIGMLLRNEADVIVSVLSITVERMESVDFSFPLHIAPVTFITTKPEYSSDIAAFFRPFTRDLWISLISFLAIMPAIFATFFKGRCRYGKLLLATFRSLLAQSFGIRPQNVKQYLLIFFYIVGTLFLIHSYTCVLLSFITFPTFSGVRTIHELATSVAAGKHKCVSFPGSSVAEYLLKSEDSSFRTIGRDLVQNQGSHGILDVLRSSDESSKRAFVAQRDLLNPFKEMYFISQDVFVTDFVTFGTRKDFCCREQVTRFMLYLNSYGLMKRIIEHYAFRESLKQLFENDEGNADRRVRQFSLKDFSGAFIVLCTGYALSFSVLVVEVVLHSFSKNLKCSYRKNLF